MTFNPPQSSFTHGHETGKGRLNAGHAGIAARFGVDLDALKKTIKDAQTAPVRGHIVPPYGLHDTNRKPEEHYTKNRLNNSIPMSLSIWMEDNGIPPVYMRVNAPDAPSPIRSAEVPFGELLGMGRPLGECRFDFERGLDSHVPLVRGEKPPSFDVVINNKLPGAAFRCIGFENKLITTPDEKTSSLPESEWRPEVVYRPGTLLNGAMNIYLALSPSEREMLQQEAERLGLYQIRDWHNNDTVAANAAAFVEFVDLVVQRHHLKQRPLVASMVWATLGKSNRLHEKAADMFVWSDMAYLDIIRRQVEPGQRAKRYIRAVSRFCHAMTRLCEAGRFTASSVVGNSNGAQTDKEVALDGTIMRRVLKHSRVTERTVSRSQLLSLFPENADMYLEPERRFDQVMKIESGIDFAIATLLEALDRGGPQEKTK